MPLTTDRRIRYQQTLRVRGIALIVLKGARWSLVRQHAESKHVSGECVGDGEVRTASRMRIGSRRPRAEPPRSSGHISYFRISSRAYFVPTTSRYLLRS